MIVDLAEETLVELEAFRELALHLADRLQELVEYGTSLL